MPLPIASLVIRLTASSKGLKGALSSAQSAVSGFASKSLAVLKSLAKFVAGGLTAAFAGLTAIVTSNSYAARELLQVSEAFGIGVQQLTQWQAAAKKVGLESEKMNDILKDTADKLGDYLATGGGEAADIFERLGLSAKEFVGLNSGDALLKIGTAMQNLTNKEQVFLMESLADEASRLLPLFKDNAAGYKQAIEEAVNSGNILTQQQAEQSASFANSVNVLKQKFTGFGKQLTIQLAKPFSVAIEWINKTIEELGGVQAASKKFAEITIAGVEVIIRGFASMLKFFNKIRSGVVSVQVAWADLIYMKELYLGDGGDKMLNALKNLQALRAEAADLAGDQYKIDQFVDNTVKDFLDKFKSVLGQDVSQGGVTPQFNEDLIETGNNFKALSDKVKETAETTKKTTDSLINFNRALGIGAEDENAPKNDFQRAFRGIQDRFNIDTGQHDVIGNTSIWGQNGGPSAIGPSRGATGRTLGSVQDYIDKSPAGSLLQSVFRSKSDAPELNAKPSTTVTLNMVTDSGKIAGELKGNQDFIDALSRLAAKQVNKEARTAAQ